jgi:Cu/Ag efflux protein CusF
MKSMKWFVAAALAITMLIALGAKSFANCGTCGKCCGTVKAVDVDGKKITCTVKAGDTEKEIVCTVPDDAKITLDGKEAKLADLKAGDKVDCDCEKKDDAQVIKTITATREAM